jgi:hypothetical protein
MSFLLLTEISSRTEDQKVFKKGNGSVCIYLAMYNGSASRFTGFRKKIA